MSVWVQFRPGAAGTRPQRQLRAPERLFRQTGTRARAQAEGRARRGRWTGRCGRRKQRSPGRTSSGCGRTCECRRAAQRRISRRALFARDGWECVYCGTTGVRLTLDHVVPRSRGGDSVWENVVTSCAPCNLRKGDRLPEEVAMVLPKPPRPPTPALFIRLAYAAHSHRLAAVPRAARRGGRRVTRVRPGDVGHAHP